MKSVAFVPIVLITCSASPTRKGGRKWHRKPENLEDAKKLRRRFMKITDVKDVGLLAKGGGYYDKKEEAYDPAAYDATAAAASYEDDRRLAVNAGMSGSCPTDDVVTCEDGFATFVGGNATVDNPTCQEACAAGGGECCVGVNEDDSSINSCTRFNGKVCKSGAIPSCSDNRTSGFNLGRACFRANITEVVNGCNGKRACDGAGYKGGIGRVVNGCHGGDYSCTDAASYGGYIKEIVDSCIGRRACNQAADGGNIGYINHGCRGVEACTKAACYGGFIGYINHGCRGDYSCRSAAYEYERSIDGISYACNNISACRSLADGFNGFDSIDSAVVSCCNEVSECTGFVVNASGVLPDQCGTSSPTSSPTTEPTVGPTVSPVTSLPTTSSPTTSDPTVSPSQSPDTSSPSKSPSLSPVTSSPSKSPSLSPVTSSPTTSDPTVSPSLSPETSSPSKSPSLSPVTSSPVTASPTAPSIWNTASPTAPSIWNTASPTTSSPITASPTDSPVKESSGKSGRSASDSKASKSEASSKSSKAENPITGSTKSGKGSVNRP